jgi:hypothetical protein
VPSQGGIARAEKLSPAEKTAIARRAAVARWNGNLPQATHDGDLDIIGQRIACAVLNTRKRVLTQETFLTSMGRAPKAKGGTGVFRSMDSVDDLPPFLAAENLKPFINDELRASTTPIIYISLLGAKVVGFDAMLLPQVCNVYVRAAMAGVLTKPQMRIAETCNRLQLGFAQRGIIALVDDATGYAEDQANDELAKIIELYVSPEFRPYLSKFPPEFFEQIYRIMGWEYKPGNAKRTPLVGKLINKYIYEPLPPGVLDELRRLNPVMESGWRRHKHYNYLTSGTGIPHLDIQIRSVTLLLKAAEDKDDFVRLFDRAYPKQLLLPRSPLKVELPEAPTLFSELENK